MRKLSAADDEFIFAFGQGTDHNPPISVLGNWYADFHLVDGTVLWGTMHGYTPAGDGWIIETADDEVSYRGRPVPSGYVEVKFGELEKVVIS